MKEQFLLPTCLCYVNPLGVDEMVEVAEGMGALSLDWLVCSMHAFSKRIPLYVDVW